MTRNFPIEQNVLHSWACSDIVNDHVPASFGRLSVDDDSDVRYSCTQIPGDEIPRAVVVHMAGNRESGSVAAEENAQVGNPPVINVRVGAQNLPTVRINCEVLEHVLVNFLLKIDSNRTVSTNDFIRAHSSVAGNVTTGIWNANIRGIVSHRTVHALNRSGAEIFQKLRLPTSRGNIRLSRCDGDEDETSQHSKVRRRVT